MKKVQKLKNEWFWRKEGGRGELRSPEMNGSDEKLKMKKVQKLKNEWLGKEGGRGELRSPEFHIASTFKGMIQHHFKEELVIL